MEDNVIEELAQEIFVRRSTMDRAARRRWERTRLVIAREALHAQHNARDNPGDNEKLVNAGALLGLDAACSRALELEREHVTQLAWKRVHLEGVAVPNPITFLRTRDH